ncbi:MAG: kelch repeat-containing protein [Planctomycetota bacterium]
MKYSAITVLAVPLSILPGQQWRPELPSTLVANVAANPTNGRVLVHAARTASFGTPGVREQWWFDGQRFELATPLTAPMPPQLGLMTHDLLRDRTVWLGVPSFGTPPETWEFDGTTWQQLALVSPPLANGGMTYDLARGQVVMLDANAVSWSFDQNGWNFAASQPSMAPRNRMELCYDPNRQVIIAHGGYTASSYLADTWEFDGTSWTQVPTPHTLPPGAVAMGFDLSRNVTIARCVNPVASGTWTYDGADWTALSMTVEVPTSLEQRLVTSPVTGRCLLFGSGGPYELQANAWLPLLAAPRPTPRYGAAAASDLRRDTVLVHGGRSSPTLTQTTVDLQDLWLRFGDAWIEQQPIYRPSARSFHAMVHDEANDRTVLFGGLAATTYLGDTWRLTAGQWATLPGPAPSPRARFGMTYDALHRRVVLFGGEGASGRRDDTWTLDLNGWSPWSTGPGPTARSGLAFAYDAAAGRCVLFGGETAGGDSDETWALDDNGWHQLAPMTTPAARHGASLAYDPFTGSTTLYGGSAGTQLLDDLWQLRGDDWTPVATNSGPTARAAATLVARPARQRLELICGFQWVTIFLNYERPIDEHWLLLPDAQASAAVHGTGCPGSNGVPTLTPAPGSVPALGGTFTLQLDHAPTSPGIAAIAFGTGLATFLGQPLPLDLQALGMPGCALWIAPEQLVTVATAGGSAALTIQVPAVAALSGAPLVAQAYVPDAGAAGQATVSNAVAAVLR